MWHKFLRLYMRHPELYDTFWFIGAFVAYFTWAYFNV